METGNKKFETVISENPYEVTSSVLKELKESFPYYQEIIKSFQEGYSSVELRKRYMIRAIDEAWVSIIEDTIPSLETIIRAPQATLKEEEEVVPIEKTKRVTSKAITHLIQHSQYINEIEPNGFVRPAKLLNVYQDDTVVSYEHRFINTLVNRVYAFVGIRYNKAIEQGEDEKNTVLNISQNFEHNFRKGKINLSIEISEKPQKGEVVKNYIYDSDLWKRIEKIRKHLDSFMSTPFIKSLGKNFIRPPVMRTNKILKNVDFKKCLGLWEFISSYANTGYETLIQESLETVDEKCLVDIYNTISEQYTIFNRYIENDFSLDNELDFRETDIFHPDYKDELDPFDIDEYNINVKKASGENDKPSKELSDKVELALRVALAADNMYVETRPAPTVVQTPSTEVVEGNPEAIAFKYRYSFLARLIFTQNPIQDYYTQIKNKLLSYKGCTSSIAWRHELIRHKKDKVCLINIKGKTLCLYLPLNCDEFLDSKYNFVNQGSIKNFADTPFLYKVKNPKSLKYALELIDIVASRLGLEENPSFQPKDYHYPMMTPEELLNMDPPLVRLVDSQGEVIHPADKPVTDIEEENEVEFKEHETIDTSEIILPEHEVNKDSEVIEKPEEVIEEKKIVTKQVEEKPVVIEQVKEEVIATPVVEQKVVQTEEVSVVSKPEEIEFKYRYSFLARFIMAGEEAQSFYSQIKNALMSYKGVKNNIAWRRELFRINKTKLCYVNIKGNTIDIFFALDINDYADTKLKFRDESKNSIYADTPALFKVRNPKTLRQALHLIEDLAFKFKLEKDESYQEIEYKQEPLSIEELLAQNLIRPIEGEESSGLFSETQAKVSTTKEEVKEVETIIEVPITDTEEVIQPVVTEVIETVTEVVQKPVIEVIKEPVKEVIPEPIKEEKPVIEQIKEEIKPVVKKEEKKEPTIGVLTPVNDHSVNFVYRYSYMARLIQSSPEFQDLYGEIKNFMLSFSGVKSNISWRHELFRVAKTKLAQVKLRGKAIYLYIALDPKLINEYDYNLVLYRIKNPKDFTFYLKIKNYRYMNRIKELLDVFLHSYNLEQGPNPQVSYRYEYKTNDELLSMNPPLITFVEGNGEEESEED